MIGDTLKTLSRQTVVYSFGDLMVKSLSFLLIPILTRVWDANGPEMGTYGLLHLAEAVAYLCFNLGLATAVIKVIADFKQKRSRAAVSYTAVIILGTISLALLACAWLAAPYISATLFRGEIDPVDGRFFLRLTFLATYLSTFRFVTMSLLRVEGRPWLYTLLNVINFVTYVGVAIYLVVIENLGVLGIVYANLTSSIVMLAIVAGLLQARSRRPFSFDKARSLMSFGLPLLPNGLALWALALLDRWLLMALSPTREVGLVLAGQYDVAYRFGMIVSFLLVIPLRTAWVPTLFTVRDHPDASELYGRLITFVAAIGSVVALGLAALAPEIIMVVAGPEWLHAAGPLPLIAFAYLAYGISQVADAGILSRGRTYIYPIVTATSVAINVTLCILLIPDNGMMGAAWATLIAYVWHMLLIGRISSNIASLNLEWKRLMLIVAAAIVVWVGVGLLPEMDLLPTIAAKIAVVALLPLLLWLTGFFSAGERNAIRGLRKDGRSKVPEEVRKDEE